MKYSVVTFYTKNTNEVINTSSSNTNNKPASNKLTDYSSSAFRLRESVIKDQNCDRVFMYNQDDIQELRSECKEHFKNRKGYGYMCWKPYVILKALHNLEESDTLIYIDADLELINENELTNLIATEGNIFFYVGEYSKKNYTQGRWTKMDTFIGMQENTTEQFNNYQIMSGIQIYRKNSETINFLNTYLCYCKRFDLISDEISKVKNQPGFQQHRHDQSILSILVHMYRRNSKNFKIELDPTQFGKQDSGIHHYSFQNHGLEGSYLPKPEPLVTVITPTICHKFLPRAIESVQNQTYKNIEHVIVLDKPEKEEYFKELIKKYTNKKRKIYTIVLPYNTGKDNWNGHRVYASLPHLLHHSDFISYLDEDNYFEKNHIESLVSITLENKLYWAYSLRNIVDQDGEFVCKDQCESLGGLSSTFNDSNDHLIDTSCYLLSRDIAMQTSYIWNKPTRGPLGEPDRELCKMLIEQVKNNKCTMKHTVNYTTSNREDSVNSHFFVYGNSIMKKRNVVWFQENNSETSNSNNTSSTNDLNNSSNTQNLETNTSNTETSNIEKDNESNTAKKTKVSRNGTRKETGITEDYFLLNGKREFYINPDEIFKENSKEITQIKEIQENKQENTEESKDNTEKSNSKTQENVQNKQKVSKVDLEKTLYIFHFTKEATYNFLNKNKNNNNTESYAYKEWQLTLLDYFNEYDLVDGYGNEESIPSGARVLVHICLPHCLPMKTLNRKDITRIGYTLEGPNIRHQQQWNREILETLFDKILTYWDPLLESKKAYFCPFIHRINFSNELDRQWINENKHYKKSICMILEYRELKGKYKINGVELNCLDPLRGEYAKELSKYLTVYGQQWNVFKMKNPETTKDLKIGHTIGKFNDPRPNVEIMKDYTFNLIIENCDAEDYVSEKFCDALVAGCIPVYYGNIGKRMREIIPDDIYIDLKKYSTPNEFSKVFYRIGIKDIARLKNNINRSREQILRKLGPESYIKYFKECL